MNSQRMEAFSDGVIAIIITIMVLELKVPHGADAGALKPMIPPFLGYVLSFIYVGIYWSNHHHLLQVSEEVNGAILWANLNLLFWLSMFPVVTDWVGENPGASVPTALYGGVLLLAAVAYWILQHALITAQGRGSLLRRAVGADFKGRISPLIYALGILLAFWAPHLSQGLYLLVALMWLIPDRRIERQVVRR
ncbi:MAG TPA: TMEM175 family protein [Steroidobacteraceae bacterium]|nr:TMEM175 family protein [Steroidobacteraceae bacterium]